MARQLRLRSAESYVIDASSLIDIPYLSNADDVWKIIYRLIDEGRLFTVPAVIEEVERRSERADKALKGHKTSLVFRDIASLLGEYRRIVNLYPKMVKPRGRRTTGDPYVVALAKVEGLTVVSSEKSRTKKGKQIPDVCGNEGIRHYDLQDLLTKEGRTVKARN